MKEMLVYTKNFIPKTNEELINKMKKDNFKGTYNIKNNITIWNISDEVFLEIILNNQPNESYISYNCKIDNKDVYITHEHPEMEESNNETNTLVIKKTFLVNLQNYILERVTNLLKVI